MTEPTDNSAGKVVAAMLYSRGAVSLAEAVRMSGLTEAAFHEAISTTEQLLTAGALRPALSNVMRIPPDFKLSVLMPVYNEARTILEILDRVMAVKISKEIVVVDDGSSDGTVEVLKKEVENRIEGVRVFYSPRNQGKGAAVRRAIKAATGSVCVVQDADLEYDPEEYFQLLEPILDGRADAVYGTRFMGGGPHRVHLFWHYVGNQILTTISNAFSNLNLTDMETCYKLMRTELAQSLPLRANGFDIEPELTLKLAKAGARIYEVPISYSGRSYSEGKKINWKDGVKALYSIVRYRVAD
jgi:glycosyltransferase involved in cell wall biosynthesis